MSVRTAVQATAAGILTTDNFTSIPWDTGTDKSATKLLVDSAGPLSFELKNTGSPANSITYQVLGKNRTDTADADAKVVVASAALASGVAIALEIAIAYYQFYELQIKATVGASQGTVKAMARLAGTRG